MLIYFLFLVLALVAQSDCEIFSSIEKLQVLLENEGFILKTLENFGDGNQENLLR